MEPDEGESFGRKELAIPPEKCARVGQEKGHHGEIVV